MKKCIKKESIVAYCYGELMSEKIEEIHSHLAICVHCKSKADVIKRTISLARDSKLKQPPANLLEGYSDEIRERLIREERESGILSLLGRKVSGLLDNLWPLFFPRLLPAFVTACVIIFAVALIKYDRQDPSLQDIALLDEIGEDSEEFTLVNNEDFANELRDSDLIMLAQLEEDTGEEDVLYDAALLDELDEESLGNGDIDTELETIDDLDLEATVG